MALGDYRGRRWNDRPPPHRRGPLGAASPRLFICPAPRNPDIVMTGRTNPRHDTIDPRRPQRLKTNMEGRRIPRLPRKLGILVGGGPAPGINGVIGAAAIEAINNGFSVTGFYDGFQWLSSDRFVAERHAVELTIPSVARIHFEGG